MAENKTKFTGAMGKTCLYFRRLADLDKAVLKKIVVGSIAEAKRLHR